MAGDKEAADRRDKNPDRSTQDWRRQASSERPEFGAGSGRRGQRCLVGIVLVVTARCRRDHVSATGEAKHDRWRKRPKRADSNSRAWCSRRLRPRNDELVLPGNLLALRRIADFCTNQRLSLALVQGYWKPG